MVIVDHPSENKDRIYDRLESVEFLQMKLLYHISTKVKDISMFFNLYFSTKNQMNYS